MRAIVLAITLSFAASIARAQIATTPPPNGTYEAWSSIRMTAVGRLVAVPPPDLPEWIEVSSTSGRTRVTFVPERRVVWRIAWGPNGATEKVIEVDGEPYVRARYEYDARGRVTRKLVDGPGIQDAPWTYDYALDAQGRPIARRTTHPAPRQWMSRALPGAPMVEEQRIAWSARGIVVTTLVDGRELRVDQHDAEGRLLRTRFGPGGSRSRSHELRYVRGPDGALVRVERRLGSAPHARVTPAARDHTLVPVTFEPLVGARIERREARMLLGAPGATHEESRGVARRVTDDWADGCWLNAWSAIEWDAAGLAVGVASPCICGLCVDAALAIEADEVVGFDLHFTAGPWVRLDGSVDTTIDHRVITPRGPVPAGELRAGDEVIGADGSIRVLRSVEPLLESRERLGRNVRTRSATFAAGGLLFESEPLVRCAPQ